jgi:hypothetical protein
VERHVLRFIGADDSARQHGAVRIGLQLNRRADGDTDRAFDAGAGLREVHHLTAKRRPAQIADGQPCRTVTHRNPAVFPPIFGASGFDEGGFGLQVAGHFQQEVA